MSRYTIPNEADAFNPNQAEPDSQDFKRLAYGSEDTGVVLGEGSECLVEPQAAPDMTVKVAAGEILINGIRRVVSADASVTIQAADATNPRIDLICVNTADGTVVDPTAGDGKGVAAAEPVDPPPGANRIVLATVYVPATDTTIAGNQITDKRIMVRKVPTAEAGGNSTSVPNATDTKLTLDTSVHDNDGIADLGSDRLVVQTPGVYQITANVQWGVGSNDDRLITLKKNGVALVYQGVRNGLLTLGGTVTAQEKCVASDNFEVFFLHNAGVPLGITLKKFTITKVADA